MTPTTRLGWIRQVVDECEGKAAPADKAEGYKADFVRAWRHKLRHLAPEILTAAVEEQWRRYQRNEANRKAV